MSIPTTDQFPDDPENLSPARRRRARRGLIPEDLVEIANDIENLAYHYNLGIIANQPAESKKILEDLDLLKYFKVHGISKIVGLSKPDPDFFTWALIEANCPAEKALMIGDRIDNDVKPAHSIGMKTLWLKLNFSIPEAA